MSNDYGMHINKGMAAKRFGVGESGEVETIITEDGYIQTRYTSADTIGLKEFIELANLEEAPDSPEEENDLRLFVEGGDLKVIDHNGTVYTVDLTEE